MQGKQVISWKPCKTDKKGNFRLEFNVGGWGDTALVKDTSAWLHFYAVRNTGDTVLLHSGYMFSNGFEQISDQAFSTTFYLK